MRFGKRTIGIIGGMGPEATSDFYMRIIRIFQVEFHARYDKDYPPILIVSTPIPDVVQTVENATEVLSYLTEAAKTLEAAGADFIAIPCNTVHIYLSSIRSAVRIPVLSMIEETAKNISHTQSPLGLLGTKATLQAGVYQHAFRERGIAVILPTNREQEILTEVIMNTLGHTDEESSRMKLRKLISNLKTRGAKTAVLACTELPIVAEPTYGLEIINPTEILTHSCVALTTGQVDLR